MSMKRSLREQIEEFYLPRQLVEAILEVGEIPRESEEVEVGVGFIDIADYTFLSKFLTPKENQEVLNGLYTAFNGVLRKHGGYLNKIEGDSLMFHFGGLIDPVVRKTGNPEEIRLYMAKELFFTCVEMQRVSLRFNSADDRFLEDYHSEIDRQALSRAFAIMQRLRSDDAVANPLSAMFQIRIRVGANLGEVTIGNFGPDGARQWDVIGMPVINAKRMESTAPVGGLRISRDYYEILNSHGFLEEYRDRFCREARALGSRYATITWEELFAVRQVRLWEKGGAAYETCSIQVNPALPEQMAEQVLALLAHGRFGAKRILSILKYYRGNRHVIEAIEEALVHRGVILRRSEAYEIMYPQRFAELREKSGNEEDRLEAELCQELSLFDLFTLLGRYQDAINHRDDPDDDDLPFASYDRHVALARENLLRRYEEQKAAIAQRAYFHNVVFPLVFASIFSAILEHQSDQEDLELLSG
ncbi:adenylate/guanylate cyclase domain-containing protein [Alkalispirochaeta sphaeroplastigenens]|nr:adenylate/guanylate cyclase domain-containing protein [Alkalispirochaeta sphaeroplastigenens]